MSLSMSLSTALRKLARRDGPAQEPETPRGTASGSVSGTYYHEREPRPEWVAALRDVSPITELHGTLDLVWEPGDPWTPGQRWTLYEMIPWEQARYELVLALRGPNPRLTGHMCTARSVPGQFACLCKVKLEGWRNEDGEPSDVTLTQWKLFQRTGKVGRLFWVIQGDRGGHKAFLTTEEKKFLAAAGKATEMPGIGTLPYADFDTRVVDHVVRFNRMRQAGLGIQAYRRRMGRGYKLHQQQAERQLRADLVTWLDEQMADNSDGPSTNELFLDAANTREMDAHAPRTDVDWEKVGEEGIAAYVETGQLLHPSKVK